MALPAPTGMYVRQDVDQLDRTGAWDPYTLAYADAVGAMQEISRQDPSDPRGWTFQASMYAFPPEVEDPDPLWGGCRPGSRHFLPWHRMLLYMFERIVRSLVVARRGPRDWALPFWNWSANPSLPPPFRQEMLPDGRANPLHVADHRNPYPPPGVNGGATLPPEAIEIDYALSYPSGSRLEGLESLPHDLVHDLVGGPSDGGGRGAGWMCDPHHAALDPIFWLHRANIDRLWVVWMTQGGRNPDDPEWANREFWFYDGDARRHGGTCAEVSTTLALGYTYSYPSVAAQPPEVLGVAEPPLAEAPAARPAGPETELGAADEPVRLGAMPTAVEVPLGDEAESAVRTLSEPRESRRPVYLTLEDVTLEGAHPGVVYAVYLNKPAGVSAAEARTYRAGVLSFFGLMHADGNGSGERASAYDVTSLVAFLSSLGDWDPARARVTFEPLGLRPAGLGYDPVADYLPDEPQVRVGRVCLKTR
jgi:hypothetical protein